jgi:cyclohexanone monooxygenase
MRDVDVAVIGGGISGIGAAIAIRAAGLGEVLVLERAGELGGTWRDNTYPGCACDIPSVIYSYPFAPNPGWTRVFARREEIQEYVLRTAREHDVPACTSLDTEVHDATWDTDAQRWRLDTSTGPVTARAVVLAAGPLHEPVMPDVPGLDRFRGTAFHSARWRHDHDLRGRRVAVIGTGASAAQFVPRIQRDAAHVTVFQRTPPWVMPKMDWRIGRLQRAAVRRWPALQRFARQVVWTGLDAMILTTHHARLAALVAPVAKWNIRRAIRDPALRRALTPDYTVGCKRVLISNDYYPALAQPNVALVPHAVREVREHSVIDSTGVEHEVDTIIFGTGFHVTDLPIADRVRGRDGRSLAEIWDGSPRAYKGTTISGFPNAFMLFGPNIGTASAFVMLDAQLTYVISALRTMRSRGWSSVDVRAEELAADKARVDARLARSAWNAGGCTSYYLDAKGNNASVFPGTMRRMRRVLRRFDPEVYETVAAGAREEVRA